MTPEGGTKFIGAKGAPILRKSSYTMSKLRMNADGVVQMFDLIDISQNKMTIYSAVNLGRIPPAPFSINIHIVAAGPSTNVELNVTVYNLSTMLNSVLQRITSLQNAILSHTVLPARSTVAAFTQKSSASSVNPQLQSSGTSDSTVIKSSTSANLLVSKVRNG